MPDYGMRVQFPVGLWAGVGLHVRPVAGDITRILSDIHFGDHASQVHRLAQIKPLLEGAARVVLNGDTLDTRTGPRPQFTAALREEVLAFFPRHTGTVTFLTGNHDPDISTEHATSLAGGLVEVTHGDILFENMTPWGRDVPQIERLLNDAFAAMAPGARERLSLTERYALWRRVAVAIPQRHQAEPNRLKYLFRFATDTVWPPQRPFRIIHIWRTEAERGAAFARRHLAQAKFLVLGHTHRPHISRTASGVTVINTGAYCRPFKPYAVDVTADRLVVREIVVRAGEYRLGGTAGEFAL